MKRGVIVPLIVLLLGVLLVGVFSIGIGSDSVNLAPRTGNAEQTKFSSKSSVMRGDVNGDGRENTPQDLLELLYQLRDNPSLKDISQYDINGDGKIDGGDVVKLSTAVLSEYERYDFTADTEETGDVVFLQGGQPPMPWECPPPGTFIRGDVDGSGSYTITDAIVILEYMWVPPYNPFGLCKDEGDANDDGLLNIADPVYHLLHIFAGGPQPPAPNIQTGPGYDEQGRMNGIGPAWNYCDLQDNDLDNKIDETECPSVAYNLHFGEELSQGGPATLTDNELGAVLADGMFDGTPYTQTITLASQGLEVTHFGDNDFSNGASSVGIHILPGQDVYTYVLDFSGAGVTVPIGVGGALPDLSFKNIDILGSSFWIADANYIAGGGVLGLDLVHAGILETIEEGQTETYIYGGVSYTVQIGYIDFTEVNLIVNGISLNYLEEGESFNLGNGVYVAIQDISFQPVVGGVGQTTFSIGRGVYELEEGDALEIGAGNYEQFQIYFDHTATPTTFTLDKIIINRVTDDEEFIAYRTILPWAGGGGGGGGSGPLLPIIHTTSFNTAQNTIVANTVDHVFIEPYNDDLVRLTAPVTDGEVAFDIFFMSSNNSTSYAGIGGGFNELLASSPTGVLEVDEDIHELFFVSYLNPAGTQAETYGLRIDDIDDSSGVTVVTLSSVASGSSISISITVGETEDIGNAQITLTSADENTGEITLLAGPGVTFNDLYTPSGLKIKLPYTCQVGPTCPANWVFTPGMSLYELWMYEENAQGFLGQGEQFRNEIGINGNFQTTVVGAQGNFVASSFNGFLDMDSPNDELEAYVESDFGTRIIRTTGFDQDTQHIYYHDPDAIIKILLRTRVI